ncbi:MAG TPA: glycosyltransferase [Opitutaceae bacterium]|jgi:glycosyltransferase involved in cell wall biosynthesis|nr:glycosyltransferase [Opitutaceae bacterium]
MRSPAVLHFLGYDEDRGGVLTAIRLLAAQGGVRHGIVVNRGYRWRRAPRLPALRGPRVACETISSENIWRCLPAALWLLPYTARRRAVVHGQSRAGLLVALWLWLLGQNAVVAQPHCYGRRRWFYRWAAQCLGENFFWLSPAMQRHYGLAPTWSRCRPEPAPGFKPRSLRVRNDVIVLGGAGTFAGWKGWHLVLAALAALPVAMRGRFRFVHIGDTDGTAESAAYREGLMTATARLGLTAQVDWRGWRRDSAGLLDEIDALLIPSANEPMALAGLEALAAGVPLVIADSGGLNDVVAPGRNALVFRTGDAADLAARIAELPDFLPQARVEPADLASMAAPRMAAAWTEVYARVLGRHDQVV